MGVIGRVNEKLFDKQVVSDQPSLQDGLENHQ